MTLFDILTILALFCAMEARNCYKRRKLWEAINELDNRKLDIEP